MSHLRIPANWKVKRSTPFFTKDNVPAALLSHHNTAAGVFGQLCVMEGTVTYYGFANEDAKEPEVKVEVTVFTEAIDKTIEAVKKVHPYEEPVINVLPLWRTSF